MNLERVLHDALVKASPDVLDWVRMAGKALHLAREARLENEQLKDIIREDRKRT